MKRGALFLLVPLIEVETQPDFNWPGEKFWN